MGLGREVFSFGGGQLSLRLLDRGCPTHLLQRIQVVSRHIIRGLRLHQSGGGRVVISSGNCAFREKLLPCRNNLLLQLKLRLCLRHIQLGLMVVFRHLGLRLHVKGSLRRCVLTLVIERLGAEDVYKRQVQEA